MNTRNNKNHHRCHQHQWAIENQWSVAHACKMHGPCSLFCQPNNQQSVWINNNNHKEHHYPSSSSSTTTAAAVAAVKILEDFATLLMFDDLLIKWMNEWIFRQPFHKTNKIHTTFSSNKQQQQTTKYFQSTVAFLQRFFVFNDWTSNIICDKVKKSREKIHHKIFMHLQTHAHTFHAKRNFWSPIIERMYVMEDEVQNNNEPLVGSCMCVWVCAVVGTSWAHCAWFI